MFRKYHNHKLQTNPRHHEEVPYNNYETPGRQNKQSKPTSSLFPIKVIAKLEWTQSNAQQHIEQLLNPTMGVKINKESTFAIDSAVVEAHKMLNSHGGFLTIAMYHQRETIYSN